MDVRCDRCQTEYELDDASVAERGASVQCTTCGHTFIVSRKASSTPNADWVRVMRATRPSRLSSTMAMKIATAAFSHSWFIACTIA